MDSLSIDDLELRARIGVTEAERRTTQRLLVSVRMEVDLQPAGETDDLAKCIDYDRVIRAIRDEFLGERQTLEAAAEAIAQAVLRFPCQSVSVTVRKFPYGDSPSVSASVTRVQRVP